MKNVLKKKRGVTLVALIITLIIMLILVAVTVTSALKGGLFSYTKTAANVANSAIATDIEMASSTANITTQGIIDQYGEELIVATLYGDANVDGEVNSKDVSCINSYLAGAEQITTQGLVNADVTLDGVVNFIDVRIIRRYTVGYNIAKPYPVTLFGDADLNGVTDARDFPIIYSVIQGTNTNRQIRLNADVNIDGVVSQTDITIISLYLLGKIEGGLPFIGDLPADYGDANVDGLVDSSDVSLISAYIQGQVNLSGQGYINADVNLDGIVNEIDKKIIIRYLGNYIPLPYPVTDFGDIDSDGNIDATDCLMINRIADDPTGYTTEQVLAADINLDGVVDENDYNTLMKMVMNIITMDLPYIGN